MQLELLRDIIVVSVEMELVTIVLHLHYCGARFSYSSLCKTSLRLVMVPHLLCLLCCVIIITLSFTLGVTIALIR